MRLPVDPAWGIPHTNCWVFLDTVTGYARPFESAQTTDALLASPIRGVVLDFVRPGDCKEVNVITRGWFEVQLGTPGAVRAGVTLLAPSVVDGVVSNDIWEITEDDTTAVMVAIEHRPCLCLPCNATPCTTAAAADDDSPSDPLEAGDASYAIGLFNNECHICVPAAEQPPA
jgi:hypothetical protein